MKKIFLIVILGLVVACGSSEIEDSSFENLEQAVDFIATSLETTNDTAIANACLDIKNQRSFNGALSVLRWINEKEPIQDLYANKSFPIFRKRFTLGGHNKELGHVHICFIKTDGVWRLEDIFECK